MMLIGHFSSLQALMAQQNRDDKIKELFLTMRDMLEFVGDVDALPKISNLQCTVSSMMKQIYECALFIQEYGKMSLARTCRCALHVDCTLSYS
jgi:hypothetical protein